MGKHGLGSIDMETAALAALTWRCLDACSSGSNMCINPGNINFNYKSINIGLDPI